MVLLWLVALAVPMEATFTCGVAQATKIVGGVNAALNEFPWQVCTVGRVQLELGRAKIKTALKIMKVYQNSTENFYKS